MYPQRGFALQPQVNQESNVMSINVINIDIRHSRLLKYWLIYVFFFFFSNLWINTHCSIINHQSFLATRFQIRWDQRRVNLNSCVWASVPVSSLVCSPAPPVCLLQVCSGIQGELWSAVMQGKGATFCRRPCGPLGICLGHSSPASKLDNWQTDAPLFKWRVWSAGVYNPFSISWLSCMLARRPCSTRLFRIMLLFSAVLAL